MTTLTELNELEQQVKTQQKKFKNFILVLIMLTMNFNAM